MPVPQTSKQNSCFSKCSGYCWPCERSSQWARPGECLLSHISACDGIFHLTRAFEDDDITHVEGSVDPVRDIEIIHEELQLKDEEMVGPIIDKLEKVAVRGGDKN